MNRNDDSLSNSQITRKSEDDRLEMLYEEIRGMDDLNRSIILRHLDGFSYREISESLGISISNVGVLINMIKVKLIENFGEEKS